MLIKTLFAQAKSCRLVLISFYGRQLNPQLGVHETRIIGSAAWRKGNCSNFLFGFVSEMGSAYLFPISNGIYLSLRFFSSAPLFARHSRIISICNVLACEDSREVCNTQLSNSGVSNNTRCPVSRFLPPSFFAANFPARGKPLEFWSTSEAREMQIEIVTWGFFFLEQRTNYDRLGLNTNVVHWHDYVIWN